MILIGLFVFLLLTYFLFRYFQNFTMLYFLLIQIFLTPYWYQNSNLEWFNWIKVYSVTLGIFFLYLIRVLNKHKTPKMIKIIYILLSINIFEAVLKEATLINLPSMLNIVTGLLLILFIWKTDKDYGSIYKKDLLTTRLTFPWIISYTIWNWCFVYTLYDDFSLIHIPILLAPIVIECFIRRTWLQARAITLGTYLTIYYLHRPFFTALLSTTLKVNYNICIALIIFNIIFFTLYFLFSNKKKLINS